MRIAKRVAAVLVLVILLLAGGEVGARILVAETPSPWRTNLLLGIVRAPSYKANKESIDTREPFVFETNELGLRGKSMTRTKKAPRILFAGGSTTENSDLPEERTFPGITERLVSEKVKVEVGNAGVPGATSATALSQVAHRLLALEPDAIVILEPAMNDLHDALRAEWDPSLAHLSAPPPTPKLADWLSGRSRLFAFLQGGRGEPKNALGLRERRLEVRRSRPVKDPDAALLERGVAPFAANLKRTIRMCKDAGVPVLVLTEPVLLKESMSPAEDALTFSVAVVGTDYNMNPKTELAAIERYNVATREAASSEGAILVDVAASVPRDLEHFVDDVHFSGKGNDAVARAIVEKLLVDGKLIGKK